MDCASQLIRLGGFALAVLTGSLIVAGGGRERRNPCRLSGKVSDVLPQRKASNAGPSAVPCVT